MHVQPCRRLTARLTLCGILALGFGAERLRPFVRLSSERFKLLPPRVGEGAKPLALGVQVADRLLVLGDVTLRALGSLYGPLQLLAACDPPVVGLAPLGSQPLNLALGPLSTSLGTHALRFGTPHIGHYRYALP
jgi:hypothetical protein